MFFWDSGPFVTSFEFGPQTLSMLFYRVFESCCLVIYFVFIRRYFSLNVISCLSFFYLNFVFYSNYVSYFILNFVKCYMSYVECFVLFRKFVKVMFVLFKLIVFRTLMSFIFNYDKCYFRI